MCEAMCYDAVLFFDLHRTFGRKQNIGDLDINPRKKISHNMKLQNILNSFENCFDIRENIQVLISQNNMRAHSHSMNGCRFLLFSFSLLFSVHGGFFLSVDAGHHIKSTFTLCSGVCPGEVLWHCDALKTRIISLSHHFIL